MARARLFMRKTREILRQKWSQGRSHRAVAASLGVSVGKVSSTLSRAGRRKFGERQAELAFDAINQWHMGSCPAPDDRSILRCECGVGTTATETRRRLFDAIERELEEHQE